MISVYESTPRKYYDDSRDFQFLGRVFEVLFNYLKMNVDLSLSNQISANSDIRMLPLLAKTLGFESKHEYNTEDLKALCSSFVSIVRKKGSMEGINEAVSAFLSAQNIETEASPERNPSDYMDLQVYLPAEVRDATLLEDVFDYILPAGMTYNFVTASSSRKPSTTESGFVGKAWHKAYSPAETGQVTSASNATRPDQVPDSERNSLTGLSSFALGAVVGGRPVREGGN